VKLGALRHPQQHQQEQQQFHSILSTCSFWKKKEQALTNLHLAGDLILHQRATAQTLKKASFSTIMNRQ